MRRIIGTCVVALVLPGALQAQEPLELPEYTPEQRWERNSTLTWVAFAANIRHAKDMGQSIDEFGQWWADLFDDSWGDPGSYGPVRVMRGMHRNWVSWHGGEVEVVELSDDVATARFNRTGYLEVFGEDGMLYGVSVEEFERVNELFARGIADHHGLEYEQSIDGDHVVMTFRRP